MNLVFYITAAVAIIAALAALTRKEAMHGILYLVVVLLALALLFFQLGAPFVAALEIIVYAGAIVILFLFVVMMINPPADAQGAVWVGWIGPMILIGILAFQFGLLLSSETQPMAVQSVDSRRLGQSFFQNYAYTLHLVGIFLLVGLIGAFHLGRNGDKS